MNDLSKTSVIRWLVPLAFIATVVINYMSQEIPFNGQTNSEVSDKYHTLFTPADYAFSIWSVIYMGIGLYSLFQLLWASLSKKIYEEIGIWLIAALFLSSAWLPAFQYEKINLSAFILILAFLCLTKISQIIARDKVLERVNNLWLKFVFGLYYGWVTVAAMINIAVVWKYMFGMVNENLFTIIMLIVGLVVCIYLSRIFHNAVISLTFSWAYLAIAFKAEQSYEVFLTAIIFGVVLIIFSLFYIYQQRIVHLNEVSR